MPEYFGHWLLKQSLNESWFPRDWSEKWLITVFNMGRGNRDTKTQQASYKYTQKLTVSWINILQHKQYITQSADGEALKT